MNEPSSDLIIRELNSVEELKDSEQFQKDVWGEDDPPDNSDLMLAIQHEGGFVAGAFKEGRMLGFLFGFPTSVPHIQHSHRLAVHPDSRGLGLGLKLKWYQRDWCLKRNITKVRWTYDPLRRVNAGLNITRLGATSNTYHMDYYGKMVGINAGIPSDRIVVDWCLDTPEVTPRADHPREPVLLPADSDILRVGIPNDLDKLLSDDPKGALDERLRVREALMTAFDKGFHISGFDVEVCEYQLTKPIRESLV